MVSLSIKKLPDTDEAQGGDEYFVHVRHKIQRPENHDLKSNTVLIQKIKQSILQNLSLEAPIHDTSF